MPPKKQNSKAQSKPSANTTRKRGAPEKSPTPNESDSQSENEEAPKKRARTSDSTSKSKSKSKSKTASKVAPKTKPQKGKAQAGSTKAVQPKIEPHIFVVTSTVKDSDHGNTERCIAFYSTLKSANTAAKRRLKKITDSKKPEPLYDGKGYMKATGMSGPYKEFMVTVKERPVWGPDLAQGEKDATGDETGSEGDSEDEEFEDDEDDDWENSARAAKDRMYAEEEEEGIQYVPRKQPQF